MKTGSVARELRRIASRNGGLLLPEDVVNAARSKSSAMHSYFTWDNTRAAEKYRLFQARNLIRVVVEDVGDVDHTLARVFVSLTSDRMRGGYRATVEVMNQRSTREQLLIDAREEMERFVAKYNALRELASVFASIRQALSKLKSQ